ncbi:TRAP transporter small permease [Acidimangrovimonas pyrenivorans]|uniref:TRAP transporter small permease protein n=1 Tax=Acidimangrovimonas pyrenivorans TaxID=2030798 RepID=A0ABV7AFI2_9RHOB
MALARQAEATAGRMVTAAARWMAYGGGVVLTAAAVLTVVSIIGRALLPLGLGPVKGDYELVGMGCALAIFSFLPWCQLRRGHVTVDIFVSALPLRVQAALGFIGDTVLTLCSFVILWRLYLGFGEKYPYGSDAFRAALGLGSKPYYPETTYELAIPVWIPYGFAVIGAAVFFLVCLYTMWRSLNWTLDGQEGGA